MFSVWKTDLSLYRPKSWLIGYWSLASLVWMVFLVISLFHMRNGQKLAMQVRSNCLKVTTANWVLKDLGSLVLQKKLKWRPSEHFFPDFCNSVLFAALKIYLLCPKNINLLLSFEQLKKIIKRITYCEMLF